MRHQNKINPLGRTSQHRKAMLSNMATSLIVNKHITTTTAKAKVLRRYVEPLITRAKQNSTHNRRIVFSMLRSKEAVDQLFGNVAEKIADNQVWIHDAKIRRGFFDITGTEILFILN